MSNGCAYNVIASPSATHIHRKPGEEQTNRRQRKIECDHQQFPRISVGVFVLYGILDREFVNCVGNVGLDGLFKFTIQDGDCSIDFTLIYGEANWDCKLSASRINAGIFVQKRAWNLVIIEK